MAMTLAEFILRVTFDPELNAAFLNDFHAGASTTIDSSELSNEDKTLLKTACDLPSSASYTQQQIDEACLALQSLLGAQAWAFQTTTTIGASSPPNTLEFDVKLDKPEPDNS